MNTQNQIKRTLEQPAAIETIRATLEHQDIEHRTRLADQLCAHFNLHDPRGKPQRAGCLRALRELERAGHFELPPSRLRSGFKARSPRRLADAVEVPVGVPDQAQDVRSLELVEVTGEEQMRIWNELMLREHPRGAGPLVGRRLRYLIDSEHGWSGGLEFASAALRLKDREQWIGWDETGRRDHLHRVVGMSRFLIRPQFRALMGLDEALAAPALEPAAALEEPNWAEHEFTGARLGDARLSRRLVDSARVQARHPGGAFTAAASGERTTVKAYYRMIDQPDASALTLQAMLAPHRQRTLQRIKEGLRDCQAVAEQVPRTQIITVMDREAERMRCRRPAP